MKTKTLQQMEARAAATPKGAVLLWLAQYVKDKRAFEHMRGLEDGTGNEGPRARVREQLEAAIRAELRREEPERIDAAVRQAQKEADFLMLLATETEHMVLERVLNHSTQIDLATEQLHNAELRSALKATELMQQSGLQSGKMDARKTEATKEKIVREATREYTPGTRNAAMSVLGDKLMCDMIRHAYFDGQPIMLEWFAATLEDAAQRAEELIASHDQRAEEKIEGEEFRSKVRTLATWQAKMFEVRAKIRMLGEFGEYEEATRVWDLHMPGLSQEMSASILKLPL